MSRVAVEWRICKLKAHPQKKSSVHSCAQYPAIIVYCPVNASNNL